MRNFLCIFLGKKYFGTYQISKIKNNPQSAGNKNYNYYIQYNGPCALEFQDFSAKNIKMELLSYIQQTTGFSRRKIIIFLEKGFIKINNETVQNKKCLLQEGDKILISLPGYKPKILMVKEAKKRSEMILLNKPKGYVVSKDDPHNKTIFEFLPGGFKDEWYYIGRLDKNSHGLVVLTNIPEVVNAFEHPSKEIEKEYTVIIDKPFNPQDIQNCKKGILVDNEGRKFNGLSTGQKKYVENKDVLRFKKVKYYERKGKNYLNILLTEGKKRHIRRLLKSLGYKTIDLKRVRVANYTLGNIKPGKRKKVAGVSVNYVSENPENE